MEQDVGSLVHGVGIEAEWRLPAESLQERVLGEMDEVAVGAGSGREAGVKVVSDGEDALHCDVAAAHGVEGIGQSVGGKAQVIHVEVGVHAAGMHTGVGASGPGDGDLGAEHLGESLLQGLLHAGRVRLPLPAAEAAAIVAQLDEIAHLLRMRSRVELKTGGSSRVLVFEVGESV